MALAIYLLGNLLTWMGWNLLARVTSFSMARYSLRVVAPQHWSSPRDRAGFRRLLASMLPSALPKPSRMWSSSTKRMTRPWASWTSLSTFFSLSSKSPRNLAPAISWPRSNDITLLSFIDSGTSPRTIRCAKPSSMAVLPVPALPTRTGLFLVLLDIISSVLWISESLPITGSSLPARALSVRSTPYCLWKSWC